MPMNKGRRWRFSGFARIRIAPTWAMASVSRVGGKTGRRLAAVRQVALVERDVLDADDALVDFELRDAIHEQKRVAVGKNPLDGGVVERQRQVHVSKRLYWHQTFSSP